MLAIHRYYWPDTPPYASILRSIVGRWTANGHEVEVLSTQPSYKPEAAVGRREKSERVDDATVRRVAIPSDRISKRQKVANALCFPAVAFFQILLGRRRDVVMCSTAPPVVLGAAVCLASIMRRTCFVYHCMDLHPEIGALSGEFKRPLIYRWLMRVDKFTCRHASAIVVLSEDMRNIVIARDTQLADRVHIINNPALPDFEPHAKSENSDTGYAGEKLRIVFTGNLGRFQGLEMLVDAMLADDGLDCLELVFMGDGTAKLGLEQRVKNAGPSGSARVRFIAHGSPAEARELMANADFGLVSLTPDVIRYAYPSKTSTYLSEGLPIIAIVEPDSELAEMIERRELGFVVPPGDANALEETLVRIASSERDLPQMRARAREVADDLFGADHVLAKWDELLEHLNYDHQVNE